MRKLPIDPGRLVHDTSDFVHDFMLSPLGAFYVPLDPYNTNQVIGQFGSDFATSSGAIEESSHLLCPPCAAPPPCPLPGIRAQVRSALVHLTTDADFLATDSKFTTQYVVSPSAFTKVKVVNKINKSNKFNETTHYPGGDPRPKVAPNQSSLLRYFNKVEPAS